MRTGFTGLWIIVCAVLIATGAQAEEDLDFLQAAVSQAAANAGGLDQSCVNDWMNAVNHLREMQNYLSNSDYRNALRIARRYKSQARIPDVADLWDTIIPKIKEREEALDDKTVQAIKTALAQAEVDCLNATTAEDLDGTIDALLDLQATKTGTESARVRRYWQRFDHAVQFLNYWQTYIFATEEDDLATARATLENLANSYWRSARLLPRSEIQKRIAALGKDGLEAIPPDLEAAASAALEEGEWEHAAEYYDQIKDASRSQSHRLYQQWGAYASACRYIAAGLRLEASERWEKAAEWYENALAARGPSQAHDKAAERLKVVNAELRRKDSGEE